ncbi:MAG: hypothetical protein KatS3mg014_1586 [Actinomycetota bacterium]|nr:MAG: hypothetical protein KatS3mg014_1586 [Actinomycetota bacterium]
MSEATCVRCGAALPVGARFCPGCGSPVGALPPEERKIVTVVFADLVGSTELAARLDPERYREVLATYYRTVSEVLESLRGRAYDLAGDAVVGVFGIPHAHDDDAVRAVRAGLELVGRVERISERLGLPVPLRVRVGINTGPVAIGSEGAEHGLLFGATVNLAARLQEAAEPGTVLVGETTWMLTRDQVTFGEPVRVHAKGFEDTATAWPALGLAPPRRAAHDPPRRPPARAAPARGRLRERPGDLPGPPCHAARGAGGRQEPRGGGVPPPAPRGGHGARGSGEPVRRGRGLRAARADAPRSRGRGGGGARGTPASSAPTAGRALLPGR